MKRVLILAPTPFFADRGCHVHILEQALALQRRGWKVLVVTYGHGREVANLDIRRVWRLPWYRKLGPGPSWHKFYVDVMLFAVAFFASLRFKPAVIHAHLHEGALIGWPLARLFRVPLIFDCQGSLTGELLAHNFLLVRPAFLRRLWHALEGWIDRRADHILAQSTSMRRELTGRFGIPPERITMAYDGVNVHAFAPGKKNPALLAKYSILPSAPIVAFLGVLTPYQGVDDLLHAFPRVLARFPDAVLLVMGYPNVKKYRALAARLNIADSVRFTGRVPYEKASEYLSLGDIAVSPKRSQTEANGKIYNYMACGLPTVAFDTVVNRDILGDLGTFVSHVGDSAGLANAITKLLANSEERQALTLSVRQRAVAKYSWDNVAGRIERAYNRAMTPWQLQVFNVSIRKKSKWHWAEPHVAKALKPNSAPGAELRCLDVGSGVGTLSALMERRGGTWDFTETDESAAAETRKIVNGPVYTIDIFDEQLRVNTYDLITVFDVIEHVPDPQKFMNRLAELLKPGGTLILTTPADDKPFYFWRRLADSLFGIDKDAHAHEVEGFARKTLADLTKTSRLRLVCYDSFSFFFTEMVELAYNAAYIMKNRRRQTTRGYNVALSPATGEDVSRHTGYLRVLRIVYPALRAVSLLDRIFPFRKGYEWGLVAIKSAASVGTTGTARQ